jgi:hypothetical protein
MAKLPALLGGRAYGIMTELTCLIQRRKPYRGLERIAAGMASPQMADPAIVHMLGPFRHEDRVTALSAGVDGSWNKLACFSTQLHEASSVCIVRGRAPPGRKPTRALATVKQWG